MVLIVLIWTVPVIFPIGPILGFAGRYDYNPEVFGCEQGWAVQSGSSGRNAILLSIASFVLPFLVIVFLNWSVFKTAKRQIEALKAQIGSLAGCESQQQEMAKGMRERKAAADITIIICAFVMCFVPTYFVGNICQFVKNIKVPAEVVLITSGIFHACSICSPIIYSIRKRDFRTGLKNVMRRIGLYKNSINISNEVIAMNNARTGANLATEDSRSTPEVAQATQYQDERLSRITRRPGVNFQKRRLSPIPEIVDELD